MRCAAPSPVRLVAFTKSGGRAILPVLLGLWLAGCAADVGEGPVVTTDRPSAQSRATRVYDVPKFDPRPVATTDAPPLTPAAPAQPAAAKPVKIGMLVPLTGAQGALGQSMLNSAQLALADLNAAHVTLIPRDTAGSAKLAAQQAMQDGATVMLGPIFAANVRDVAGITRDTPVLAFSTDWTIATQHTAVLGFLPFSQVARVVDFAVGKGSRQFAILIPETPYGMAVAGAVRDALKQQNLPAAIEIRFNDKTLVGAAQELAQRPFDTLVLPIGGKALSSVTTALRQNDVPLQAVRVLGTGLWDDDAVARSGIIDGAFYAAPDPAKRADFIKRYTALYGAKPPRLSTLAYDTTALVSVLAARGYDPSDIATLHYPAGFNGIDGVFRIRADNLNDRSLSVLEIRNGTTRIADPAAGRF